MRVVLIFYMTRHLFIELNVSGYSMSNTMQENALPWLSVQFHSTHKKVCDICKYLTSFSIMLQILQDLGQK